MDIAIANKALELAMAWGADWAQPTQPRLKVILPALTDEQLDEYEAIARAVTTFGFAYVYDRANCEYDECAAAVRARFPWVSDTNLRQIHSQGQYYATK